MARGEECTATFMTSISASLAMHLSLIVIRYQFAFLSIHPIHSIVVEIFLKFWKCTHLQEQTPSSPLIPMASKRRVVSSWNGIIQGIYIYVYFEMHALLLWGRNYFFLFDIAKIFSKLSMIIFTFRCTFFFSTFSYYY